MGPCLAQTPPCRLDRLTSQARYVRGHFSRRAMHASGDSPWHSSAKHRILEACFFRTTPFRSMLLTLQSGLKSLAPRAQSVPAYAQVLRHSSLALSRRTRVLSPLRKLAKITAEKVNHLHRKKVGHWLLLALCFVSKVHFQVLFLWLWFFFL